MGDSGAGVAAGASTATGRGPAALALNAVEEHVRDRQDEEVAALVDEMDGQAGDERAEGDEGGGGREAHAVRSGEEGELDQPVEGAAGEARAALADDGAEAHD